MRTAGKEERADRARGTLEEVQNKAHEQKANVEQLERVVLWLEDSVGQGRKVKEEGKEEVEEVVEGKVKEEVEAQVVEEKVEVSGTAWLRSFVGN